jgi:hypothetical protein
MSLSVGIVGLPNAGKSTLFNALAARRLAETAPRPFTTIDPHEAVVAVPDRDLEKLSTLVKPEETVPATVTFIDIAGLVKGAHKGEGLGNQFLAKIREVDVIAHVARVFKDKNVPHVHDKIDPKEDIEIVNLELKLGGIEKKPNIYVLNVGEKQLGKKLDIPGIAISAKLEEELMDLDEKERKEYLDELGIKESGLEKLIKKSYELLGLITFYTIKGGEEVHAWSIKEGSSALEAAAEVHTDFAKNFIKAEVIGVDKLLGMSSWKEAKEKGKIRLEGKDYVVQDRDVIELKTST